MYKCHVCGSTESQTNSVSEIFMIAGRPIQVEHVPAVVCTRCGDATFSRTTTESIRRMLHGDARPVRSVAMDVFAFA